MGGWVGGGRGQGGSTVYETYELKKKGKFAWYFTSPEKEFFFFEFYKRPANHFFSSVDLRRLATSAQNAQPASVCASAVPEATHGTPLAVAIVSLLLVLSFSHSLSLLLFPSFSRSLCLSSRFRLSLPPCLPPLPFSLPQPLFPGVCFITAGPSTKLFAWGGGG